LEQVAKYSKDRINSKELNVNNYVGVENLLQNKRGVTTSNYVPTTGTYTRYNKDDVLIGNIRPYLKKVWLADKDGSTNGDVLSIQVKDKNIILPKYLYYILSSDEFFDYDMQNSKGAKMPRGNKEIVMKYKFSVPSLEEQKNIISILDRFDKLINDISMGLPAEIEARRKQYEYYRNKLLSFEECKYE
jgi:type I restriction enzyme S subunit